VLGHPTRPSLGDMRGALDNYRRSIDLVEPLVAKAPNRPEYVLRWLGAQSDWAAVVARTGESGRAVTVLRSLLPASRRLPGLCPDKAECLMAEGLVSAELSDALVGTDGHAALEYARIFTQSTERALKAFPDDTYVQQELATAYSKEANRWNVEG